MVLSFLFPIFTMAEEIDESTHIDQNVTETVVPENTEPLPSESPANTDSLPTSDVLPSADIAPSSEPSASVEPSAPVEPSADAAPSPEKEVIDGAALYEAFISLENEEETASFLKSLSLDELKALEDYLLYLEEQNKNEPETVTVTQAGPLICPVGKETDDTPKAQVAGLMTAKIMSLAKDTAGVELVKSATANTDGSFTIRLESYTTGVVTTQTTGVPADIILVLDQSGSMGDNFSGTTTRQQALKSSVTSFIGAVKTDATNNHVNHRIAIVTFGDSASDFSPFTTAYQTLITSVNGLPSEPSGATNIAAGMLRAKSLLEGVAGDTNRNKVVIVFTDGVPTSSQDFNTGIADSAISTAYAIKQTGATIYTIGIFGGANPSQLYGDSGFDHNSNGTKNSYWSSLRVLFWGDVTKVSIPAGNRFLNYLSSNYVDATSLGLERSSWDILLVAYEKFTIKIDPTFTRSTTGNYYLTATDTASLSSIFESISVQISSPNTVLGSNVAVRDLVSDYFAMPTGAVRVYTVECTGKDSSGYTWSSTEAPFAAAAVSCDSSAKTVSVSGFPYDQQFVTESAKPGGGHGSKLVICFEVFPRSGFWGGNEVPTNKALSGLYSGTNLIEDFDIPCVDVPLNVPFSAKNVSAYLGNTVALEDLYNPILAQTGADDWKDDYIDLADIVYDASFTAKPTDDQSPITVTASVAPLIDGSVASTNFCAQAGITLFKPELTFCDSTIYLGESTDYTANLVSVVWKHGDTVAVAAEMLGTAPELDYIYSPLSGFPKEDAFVDVAVSVAGWDINPYVSFRNDSPSHSSAPPNKEFTVFVLPCSLTVTKSGCSDIYGANQTFIFNIVGTNLTGCDYADEVNLTVVIKGNGSKTIVGLPVGSYTVTEVGAWSWRYSAGSNAAALGSSSPTSSVNIENTVLNNLWLSGTSWVQNVFSRKVG